MKSKKFVKAALCLLLLTGLGGAAMAQNVTLSGGFALSSASADVGGTSLDGDVGFGGNIYLDFLLPIGVPITLGAEVGIDTATIAGDAGMEVKGTAIPILARVAYHFDIHPKIDLFLVGKIGYVLGSAEYGGGDKESGYNGLGFGVDAGIAFYFSPRFGIFAEAGFERYDCQKKFDEQGQSFTVKTPFSRIAIFGISTKF